MLKLTEGQAHNGRSAADMFDGIKAGNILLADRAYDSNALRDWLAERGAWGNIRAMPKRIKPPAYIAEIPNTGRVLPHQGPSTKRNGRQRLRCGRLQHRRPLLKPQNSGKQKKNRAYLSVVLIMGAGQ